ncbi:NADPH:quinone reductase-like Zn-dependent oxidoreductase [Actinoplanes lutulentus]|uniref:NADPH:quinone reductase-like Zn-dependent oxidoreductase n=1 Tax=Actinoplanes lutulentus TaxID=1287878 RepID=A0A327Z6Q0_9ACTN|nr:NADP-dependent oxidoreductase [Actinoplanes lutulentus]MBB2949035.1 NADPH:quinone reductase-like Zn-dependent oxidoreductase [Actinoplanes lutulentus]RAK31359.1 NADPH:quinone reductase-like Zn-dependent oxidoreductase [Actinoplanes lutulentus]
MRAWRLQGYGESRLITIDEMDRPSPGPGEVQLRVAGTSFNPSEVGLRRGLLRSVVEVGLPYTMGWDVAGTVSELGPGVHGWAVGDRVIGRLDGGAAADYAVAPASALVRAPATIPLAHAAALPIAGLTAWQAVFEHGRVRASAVGTGAAGARQRVLVNGAGAIGRLAIQLARHAGAEVFAVASSRSAEAAVAAGADLTLPELPESVDVLLHFVPQPLDPALAALVRPGGVVVSATVPRAMAGAGIGASAAAGSETWAGAAAGSETWAGADVHFVMRDDPGQLSELVSLVDAGVVTVDIAAVRPLIELGEVHAEAETGDLPAGKTILVP